MHLEKYLPGHAIRFIEVAEAERVQSPIPIINSLQERYGFVEVPRTVADLDFKTGVSFLRGYFKNKIIDKFQIYENGILCQAEQDNALCDDFLGEVLDWLPQKFDLPIKANKIRAYLSQVEFTFDGNLGDFFSNFSDVGDLISKMLATYGQTSAAYKVSAVKMHYDVSGTPLPHNPEFVFERRTGMPYGSQVYFSSSALRTEDHLKILSVMEDLFRGK